MTTIPARPHGERLLPVSFALPGGTATLVRWLVPPAQPYAAGATLARVRLPGGGIWDLTARSDGTLDQLLVAPGAPITTATWLALARA